MASNSLTFFLVLLVVMFVLYKAASGHSDLVETWGVTMVPMSATVQTTHNGEAIPGNNQQQLFYNQNQLINTSLLNENQLSLLSQSVNPNLKMTDSTSSGNNLSKSLDSVNQYSVTNENFESDTENRANVPVFTVPGTYQSDLSPRFNSAGLNSFVRYNLPPENEQASYPNDPLTMNHPVQENFESPMELANLVEKPEIREDYQSCASANQKQYNDMNQKLIDQGSEVVNKLPVQPMNSSASGQDKPDVYYNTDRYIFALQRSRLYSQSDFIRGDIPVIPCNPNNNPYSNVWFRPSANPRVDLNAGALGIIGGMGNVPNQQTLELMARSAGGSQPTINGMNVTPMESPTQNVAAIQNSQLSNLNLGSQYGYKVDSANPPNLVQTTAFP